jgi:hypothetical protein
MTPVTWERATGADTVKRHAEVEWRDAFEDAS